MDCLIFACRFAAAGFVLAKLMFLVLARLTELAVMRFE